MPEPSPSELADQEAIKQLKARYFRYTDTKQWQALRDVFTPDATIEGDFRYESLDHFIADRGRLDAAVTTHHGHMPEIVFLAPDHARGVWALFDRVEYPAPAEGSTYWGVDVAGHRVRGYTGSGWYEEEYRKADAGWRISLLRLTRIRVDAITEPPALSLPFGAPSDGTRWLAVHTDA